MCDSANRCPRLAESLIRTAASPILVSVHVTKVTCLGCRDGAELILYRTDAPVTHGGGHIWPNPGTSAQQPAVVMEQVDQLDASALIWEFFARHHS
jgi:polyhydroxybutyrate depolymerase